VRESCPCPIDKDLIRGRRCRLRPLTAGAANTEKRESQYQNNSFHTLPPLLIECYLTALRCSCRSDTRHREPFGHMQAAPALVLFFHGFGGCRHPRSEA